MLAASQSDVDLAAPRPADRPDDPAPTPAPPIAAASDAAPADRPTAPSPPAPPPPAASRPATTAEPARFSESVMLHIVPWIDPVLDERGHDPRSTYVERFWLGFLGPSTTWLIRMLAYGFESSPEGFLLPLGQTARLIGLSDRSGKHAPFMKTLDRLHQFDLSNQVNADTLAVRRVLPWLARRQVLRLSPALRAEHAEWEASRDNGHAIDAIARRASQVALSLARLGEPVESIERSMVRWQFHPSMCRSMAEWAVEQVLAETAAASPHSPAS